MADAVGVRVADAVKVREAEAVRAGEVDRDWVAVETVSVPGAVRLLLTSRVFPAPTKSAGSAAKR